MNSSPLSSIRSAALADFERIAAIAAEGDSSDSNVRFLTFVAEHGRLLVAVLDEAVGGGSPLNPAPWRHDRAELVEHFADDGALITDAVVMVGDDAAEVLRVHSDDTTRVMAEVSASFPAGLPIRVCVPEPHPLSSWMQARGFTIFDHDVFCASDGVEFSPTVSCVHAGLA